MIQYTASNTDLQVIDTFDLATIKTIDYRIHAVDNNDAALSIVEIAHDGISVSETQVSTSVSNTRPAEFVTSTVGDTGQLLVAPDAAPTTYTITRTDTAANQYSEHTVSGRLIRADEGMGIYFTGLANNMTVRAEQQYFGDASAFITADVLGPTLIGPELYDQLLFQPFNGSTLSSDGDYTVVISSGQPRSSHFIAIATTAGERYRVQSNASYSFEEAYGKTTTVDRGSRIAVGTDVGLNDITYVDLTTTETQYNVDFVAQGETTFVSFGYGSLGSSVSFRSLTIKEIGPFPTYNQSLGTFYFKWNAIAAGSNVVVMDSNRLFVDSSNNIFINTVNCGAQQGTNKISYTYGDGIINHSLNGAVVVSQSDAYFANVTSCILENVPEEMSYVPTIVSNTVLIGLTS